MNTTAAAECTALNRLATLPVDLPLLSDGVGQVAGDEQGEKEALVAAANLALVLHLPPEYQSVLSS